MSEAINNQSNVVNGRNGLNYPPISSKVNEQPSSEQNEEIKETDLSKMPAEVYGRSQVSSSNTLEHDMENFDPKRAEDYNRKAEYLLNKLGIPYEQALSLVYGMEKEFLN